MILVTAFFSLVLVTNTFLEVKLLHRSYVYFYCCFSHLVVSHQFFLGRWWWLMLYSIIIFSSAYIWHFHQPCCFVVYIHRNSDSSSEVCLSRDGNYIIFTLELPVSSAGRHFRVVVVGEVSFNLHYHHAFYNN